MVIIAQVRYIKIQPQTTVFSTRLWRVLVTTEFVGFIPRRFVLRSVVWGWILIYLTWAIVNIVKQYVAELLCFKPAHNISKYCPCKKDSTTWQGMQKGAKFCATLLLLYHTCTSDWLNRQNIPKLQVAEYLFTLNWSTIFLWIKSLLSLNTTVILCGESWKIGSFCCLCLWPMWVVEMF